MLACAPGQHSSLLDGFTDLLLAQNKESPPLTCSWRQQPAVLRSWARESRLSVLLLARRLKPRLSSLSVISEMDAASAPPAAAKPSGTRANGGSGPREGSSLFPLIDDNDPDLKRLEELARKLAAEDFSLMSAGPADAAQSEQRGTALDIGAADVDEVEAALLDEFRALAASQQQAVPKVRIKELYLQMLKSGDSLLRDRSVADGFLSLLSAPEMDALLSLMQKDADDVVRFFDGDPEVMDALRRTTSMSVIRKDAASFRDEQWRKLEEELLAIAPGSAVSGQPMQRSPAVAAAIALFEGSLLHYAQHPDELLKLSATLPTAKEQNEFLDILFSEYTPDKMQEKIKAQRMARAEVLDADSGPSGGNTAAEQSCNCDLVAHVFKEIITRFKAFKRQPDKFSALLDRLNPAEARQLDALIKAMWDMRLEELRW